MPSYRTVNVPDEADVKPGTSFTFKLLFVFCILGLSAFISGWSLWVNGQLKYTSGCLNTRATQVVSQHYTMPEIEERYEICRSNAQDQVSWSYPIALAGALLSIASVPYMFFRLDSHNVR